MFRACVSPIEEGSHTATRVPPLARLVHIPSHEYHYIELTAGSCFPGGCGLIKYQRKAKDDHEVAN